MPGLENITQIACGANHALALDKNGRIWAWGAGQQNQLGRRVFGRHQDSYSPRLVEVCRGKAKYIASGQYHSFAVDRDDNVWSWGLNSFGEAGYAKKAGSDEVLVPYPMKCAELCGEGVEMLDGGAHHSTAVTSDGRFWVWGRMDLGQLGIKFTPEQVQDDSIIRCDARNSPRICLRPVPIPQLGNATYVACGTDHTIGIADGAAHAMGFGEGGQLGLGSYDDKAVAERIRKGDASKRVLTWAGAGGQFSIVTSPFSPASS